MRRIIWTSIYLLLLSPVFSQAKKSFVLHNVVIDCPKGGSVQEVKVHFFIDSKKVHPVGEYFEQGGHYLRANVEPREGYTGNFVITKIEWFKCGAGVYGEPRNEVSQKFNSKEATMTVNIDNASDESPCYRAWIYVDKCDGEREPEEAKVKLVTTVSVTPDAPQYPVSDISVNISGQDVKTLEDGTAFFKLKPGQHKMIYSRPLGKDFNSAKKGTVTFKSTKYNATRNLTSIGIKPYETEWEVKLPLEAEDGAGTENLYDFEIHINMLGVVKRSINEVRIVAVQPIVEVHKAGTPEDAWIPATRDMVLQEGDEISCDPDGAATLQFADMSTTVVKNTTQLKIASYFTEGGVVKTEILLKMGEVAAQVHKSEATKSDFRIKTIGDGGSVRGTVFSYRYDSKLRSSTIKVEEGMVEVSSNSSSYAPVMIKAGQQVTTQPSSIGKVQPFTGKIDFDLPRQKEDPRITVQDPLNDISGIWEITQGSYKGILTLVQDGTNLSGNVVWNNHQKGILEGGDFLMGFVVFAVSYEGDLKGYYNAKLDDTGKKMIEGKGLSNKGTESTWSAERKK